RKDLGSMTDLMAFAADTTKAAELRALAIGSVEESNGYFADDKAMHAMLALFADASPIVRAAAVVAAAHNFDWDSSDKAERAPVKKLRAEVRTAMTKLFATEPDNRVLYALAQGFERGKLAIPDRKGGPAVAAEVNVVAGRIQVTVECLRGVKLKDAKLLVTH